MGLAVVFLDIDGVICCNMAGRLEESKLSVLNSVCKATDAKVVLSTDWRRQAQLKRQVVGALKRLDIEVIGATPMRAMFQPIRPQEILEWLSANGPKFDVTSWVAIDDRDLLNEHGGAGLQGHMVRTHPSTGLTKRLGDVAIELLGGAAASGEVPEDVSKERRLGVPADAASSNTPVSTPSRTRSPARPSPFAPSAPPSGARTTPAVPTSFATRSTANAPSDVPNAFGGPAAARAAQGLLSRNGRVGTLSPGVREATPRGLSSTMSTPPTKSSAPATGAGTGSGGRVAGGRAAQLTASSPVRPLRATVGGGAA